MKRESPWGSGGNTALNTLIVWVAQGFGVGRISGAPGTWGTFVGMAYVLILFQFCSLLIIGLLLAVGTAASIWIGGRAESILSERDPGSVVIDEIIAIPWCFIGLVFASSPLRWNESVTIPTCFGHSRWLWLPIVFVLFRIFDIAKPWPVGMSQRLPRGWGITLDDVLAAGYVNLILAILLKLGS